MKKTQTTTNPSQERTEPFGDTGNGETGVPDGEQGSSNRPGDNEDDADAEFEDDDDEPDEEDEEEVEDRGV